MKRYLLTLGLGLLLGAVLLLGVLAARAFGSGSRGVPAEPAAASPPVPDLFHPPGGA